MKTRLLLIGAAALAVALPGPVQAEGHSRHGSEDITVSTSDAEPLVDCGQIRVRFGDQTAARAEETITARLGGTPLTLRVPESSGASIRGADRADTAVKACKAALRADDLPRITVALDADGHLSLSGPPGGGWLVYLLIETSRGTAVDVESSNGSITVRGLSGAVAARTSNGPISLANLSGTVRAHAENGPISIHSCRASVDARAVNGPISLSGGGGEQSLRTENGPISVDLAGDHWDGARLDAHADNGPLSVRIPDGYRTGTRIESAGHSPFTCRAAACSQGRKSWDDDSKAVEFGSGQTVVRLSTVNGPVSVKSGAETDDE